MVRVRICLSDHASYGKRTHYIARVLRDEKGGNGNI